MLKNTVEKINISLTCACVLPVDGTFVLKGCSPIKIEQRKKCLFDRLLLVGGITCIFYFLHVFWMYKCTCIFYMYMYFFTCIVAFLARMI